MFFFLFKLKWLNLSLNKISDLPTSLSTLTKLFHLDLTYNELHFASFPDSFFGGLRDLQRLYLSDNHIEKLPFNVGKLVGLKVLTLRNNGMKTLTRGIGGLQNLEELHLQVIAGISALKGECKKPEFWRCY